MLRQRQISMSGKNRSQEIKLPNMVSNQTTTVTKGSQLLSVLKAQHLKVTSLSKEKSITGADIFKTENNTKAYRRFGFYLDLLQFLL